MVARGLVDTGVLVALLDRRNSWHDRCVETYSSAPQPLLTSEAVLTEVFHLLANVPGSVKATWGLLRDGNIQIATIEHRELPDIETLMLKYADRPMDFADATLVYLARRENLQTILTIDHDDFETYRISGHRKFHIAPGRRQS
jgi:predicted nucleic acid-binding protein